MMKQETLQLTCGGDQAKRRELDFYPTPTNVTHALMKFLNEECSFYFDGSPLTIWEPACGNGAMAKVIEAYKHKVISSDIGDYGYGITGLDFLSHSETFDVDAIITNPPFNISVEFIEKAVKESRIVCMLLKSQYWHAKNRLSLFNKTKPQYVLPLSWRPDFMEHTRLAGDKKGAPTMEVAWTIWTKGSQTPCRYQPLLKPEL